MEGRREKQPSGGRNHGNRGGERRREEQETSLNEATSRLELRVRLKPPL